jgi:hypothetical protein
MLAQCDSVIRLDYLLVVRLGRADLSIRQKSLGNQPPNPSARDQQSPSFASYLVLSEEDGGMGIIAL